MPGRVGSLLAFVHRRRAGESRGAVDVFRTKSDRRRGIRQNASDGCAATQMLCWYEPECASYPAFVPGRIAYALLACVLWPLIGVATGQVSVIVRRVEASMAVVRLEQPGDVPAIDSIHAASFPTVAEARLVKLLREAGYLSVSLVAEADGTVVGHVAFSPVTAATGEVGIGLAPVAVLEPHRRQGIAAQLIEAGLGACRSAGFGWAVVLGEPAYYARFGFRPASAFGLSDEYGGGPAFQALELVPGRLPSGAGLVRYAPEFTSLG